MIDIHSKGKYPADALSNFARHPFVMDGIRCESMEGFLQALKYRDPEQQKRVCSLHGIAAKEAGARKWIWKLVGRVWWQGKAYGLYTDGLQRLIDRAYIEMYRQNDAFRKAVSALGDAEIGHSIGKTDMRTTILTEYHFVRRIEMLRKTGT